VLGIFLIICMYVWVILPSMNLVTLLSKLLTNAHVARSAASQKPDFKNFLSINEFHHVKFQVPRARFGLGLYTLGLGFLRALVSI
jgi:hypothetical protein